MAEENAATESTAARDAKDAQQAQPAADWEAKYKGAMEHARLWEDRAKANAGKAKAYDELSAQAEKSAADAEEARKRAEKAEADLERIKGERRREALVAEVASGKGVDAGLRLPPARMLLHQQRGGPGEVQFASRRAGARDTWRARHRVRDEKKGGIWSSATESRTDTSWTAQPTRRWGTASTGRNRAARRRTTTRSRCVRRLLRNYPNQLIVL